MYSIFHFLAVLHTFYFQGMSSPDKAGTKVDSYNPYYNYCAVSVVLAAGSDQMGSQDNDAESSDA